MKPWYKQRTTWSAVVLIATAVLAYLKAKGIDQDLLTLLETCSIGAIGIFLRAAMNGQDPPKP